VSHNDLPLTERAAAMRRDFDRGFGAPPSRRNGALVDLLAIRLGGQPYALRMSEVAGLFTDKPLTRMPNALPAFLGLAGFRGKALPVFDLGQWFGCPAAGPTRWGVIAAGQNAAFAFEGFDGHLRVAPQDVVAPEADTSRAHLAGLLGRTVEGNDRTRSVIDLFSVLAALRRSSASRSPPSTSE
jgi:purine-binding chemotaxis protein CheW